MYEVIKHKVPHQLTHYMQDPTSNNKTLGIHIKDDHTILPIRY
jgi:hypothetical protein